MKHNLAVRERIEDLRDNTKDMGELIAFERRENSVSIKHESSFAPIIPSQASSLERNKSSKHLKDVEIVSADIAAECSNSINNRVDHKTNHGINLAYSCTIETSENYRQDTLIP